MKRTAYLRQMYLDFSRAYADYIVLRKQLLTIKMEREYRRKMAMEMGKVLSEHRINVEFAMRELERS